MHYIASVDIGSSSTKGILLDDRGRMIATAYENAEGHPDPVLAKNRVLEKLSAGKGPADRVILTGVGATFPGLYEGENPPECVQELTAIGRGGLRLSGRESPVIMSMGTGTAYVYVSRTGEIQHMGGSALGSGTVCGLSRRLLGTGDMSEICDLSARGDANHVDLLLSEVARSGTETLTLDLTSSNFAKADAFTSREDLAAGILNLVLQNLGVLAVFAARQKKEDTVVLVGGLTQVPDVGPIFRRMEEAFGIHFLVPKWASLASAIGAAETVLGLSAVKLSE